MTAEDQTSRQKERKFYLPQEMLWAVSFFLVAAVIGTAYLTTSGQPVFYQRLHGPAVMLALGHGYFNPDPEDIPALQAFLQLKVDQLAVEDLPHIIPSKAELHPYQDLFRYPQYLIAFFWRVLGISWSSVNLMFGLLYGISVVSVYGIFRLATRRGISIFFTSLFCFAPLQLEFLPLLRDYGKVPFFFVVLLLLGIIVKYPLKRRYLTLMGIAFGMVCGVGLGFRDDLILAVCLFPLTLLFFSPVGLKKDIPTKLLSITLMVACFLTAAWPLFQARARLGTSHGHHVYLGRMARCDQRLGVGGAAYNFGGPYSDAMVKSVVESYSYRIHGNDDELPWYTHEYDNYSNSLVQEMARTFPADFVLRAYTAVARICDGMFLPASTPAPGGVENAAVTSFFKLHGTLERLLLRFGRYQVLLVILLICALNLRQGLYILCLGLYLLGVTAVQFNLRHHFHLALVPLWMTAIFLDGLLRMFFLWKNGDNKLGLLLRNEPWKSYVVHVLAVSIVIGVAMPSALGALRWYQYGKAHALLGEYATAELEPLSLIKTPLKDGKVLLTAKGFAEWEQVPEEPKQRHVQTEMLVIELDCADCPIPLRLRYLPEVPGVNYPGLDLSWTVQHPQFPALQDQSHEGTKVRLHMPVYYASWSDFEGIEVAEEDLAHVKGVYRWKDRDHLPAIAAFVTLPDTWEQVPHYQSLLTY
jgi:hypothetical protein